jgi:hypothetical protein
VRPIKGEDSIRIAEMTDVAAKSELWDANRV